MTINMRTIKLGDLTVSAQGLGCMGMSEWYGPTDWDESIATINRALDLGVTFIDTADSLWTGDVGTDAMTAMRELGVGFVPYSPLGRGFLTGTVDLAALDDNDFRRRNPRFRGQASEHNQAIADTVRKIAEANGVPPAQVALAWVYAQEERLGVPMAPIPGTKRIKWLEQNAAALDVTLTAGELALLDPLGSQVAGARY